MNKSARHGVLQGPESAEAGQNGLPEVARAMCAAACRYLDSLSPKQRKLSQFSFEEPHRVLWEFEPLGAGNARYGLEWPELQPFQQDLVRDMLRAGLSPEGVRKAEIIREVEVIQHPEHGMRSYSLWFYGKPNAISPWSWRFEGHHLSASFTVCGPCVSNTPLFIGASPTLVSDNTNHPGVALGTRPLAAEEDLSRALYDSLDDEQREVATIVLPPMSLRTPQVGRVEPSLNKGIAWQVLSLHQRDLVRRIVDVMMDNVAPPLAASRRREWKSAGEEDIMLSVARASVHCEPWGHARPGGYYYRLQSPTFLYEFDDVQWGWQDSGHIHTVWRDFEDDFGFRSIGRI